MLTIISPAKRMQLNKNEFDFTLPEHLIETKELIALLKSTNAAALQKLMKISPKLADLNFQRHSDFNMNHNTDNSSQAIFTYKGDVYRGLDINSLNEDTISFTNEHLRILTGLYGVLRPLDLIQPYRLEMGTKLANKKGKNLYEFWGNTITRSLNIALEKSGSNTLINLASDEYYNAIQKEDINGKIIKIVFKEYRDEKLKFITFNAKKARGLMTRYIMKNKINNIEELKGFDYENYYFDFENSTDNEFWFIR